MPSIHSGSFVITGGASQIGSHIAEQLLARGARAVRLLDNLSLGSSDNLAPLLEDERCTFVRGDVLRLHELQDALEGADGVFAVAGLMASSIDANAWTGLDVNIRGVQNTLEACRHHGIKKLVFSSSAGVYGTPEEECTSEEAPLQWQTVSPAMALYSASKVAGESLARLYWQQYGLDYVALRYTAVYGERQHGRALVGGHIAETCARGSQGLPAFIDGDGSQVYDYVYAGDVARANLLAMESTLTAEALNISSGAATSQMRIVELVGQALGRELEIESRPFAGAGRMPAATRYTFQRDKALRLLGWEPEMSIEQGVARVLHWVRERSTPSHTTR
jgi:UDP-glucose 4-epimerase